MLLQSSVHQYGTHTVQYEIARPTGLSSACPVHLMSLALLSTVAQAPETVTAALFSTF